jgi:hypothetical protein
MNSKKKISKLTLPYLVINNNGIKKQKLPIEKDKLIIGRLKTANDISLEPDTQKLITRYMHCSIELENNTYWLIDNASKNGTFIKKNNVIKRITGKEKLSSNDFIMILSNIDSEGNPNYWELEFIDPTATEDASCVVNKNNLDYDWVQAKLFINSGNHKVEIKGLTPQEHKLIRFMHQKNKNNGNISVMCSFEEIIEAVWDEIKITRTKNDVNHLIAALRKKIENDPDDPKFLINIRGMGYRLITSISIP